jgi:hypothetical protein
MYIIKEKFFDYGRFTPICDGKPTPLFIYINPSKTEIDKYIPNSARGFIDLKGNLYLEGLEEEDLDIKKYISPFIHDDILKLLKKKLKFSSEFIKTWHIPDIEDEDFYIPGICIICHRGFIYFAESYKTRKIKKLTDIKIAIALTKKKNPSFDFKLQ